MSCPTCDHTMQSIHSPITMGWCPRCGTLVVGGDPEAPALVQHCRQYEQEFFSDGGGYSELSMRGRWHGLGIAESINVPERRPT